MPIKQTNHGSGSLSIEEVRELHELGNLAEDWARPISSFPTKKFDRYQELCRKYGVDGATLLYVYQAQYSDQPDRPNLESTAVHPALADVQS